MTVHLVKTAVVAQSVQATVAMTVHLAASVQATATATIELLAKTAAATRVVQSARLTIAMIVHHVVTAQLMATATTQVVQSVQTMVVVTGRQEAMKARVVRLKRLGVHAMIAMRARHMATAMQIAHHVLLVTAKIVQHVQVLVVASATATVQSVLHTASLIHHASKTALQSAVGQKTAVAKSAIQTVLTVQHVMIHANQLSVAHATQTQIRRLSSKTRFLSV
jgi:hypothetical protein